MTAILGAAKLTKDILVRYSALVHNFSGANLVIDFGQRLGVSNDWMQAGVIVNRFHLKVLKLHEMDASSIVKMFYEMDAFRKPELVKILETTSKAIGRSEETNLEIYFNEVREVGAKDIASEIQGRALGSAIEAERIKRLEVKLGKG